TAPRGGGLQIMVQTPRSPRHLIVVARHDAGLRVFGPTIASVTGRNVSALSTMLQMEGVTMRPLFGVSEPKIMDHRASLLSRAGSPLPDLSVYYRIDAPDNRLADL